MSYVEDLFKETENLLKKLEARVNDLCDVIADKSIEIEQLEYELSEKKSLISTLDDELEYYIQENGRLQDLVDG
jgi:flagellar biosynthesis/type III secretory pathway chaperone